jgi:1,4-dihydroxy-2-naphthoate polyprenyltransferase
VLAAHKTLAWVRALRPLAQGNLAPFLLVGALEGRRAGLPVDGLGLGLALAWGAADHAVIVLANDLGDEAADRLSSSNTLLSGGSRVLVDGSLSRRALAYGLATAVAALLAVTAIGVALVPEHASIFASCTVLALLVLGAYGHGPRLSYRGGGEYLQALGVGVILPTVGAALQPAHTGTLGIGSYALLALLGFAGNVATSIPDADADLAAGKRSPAARLGRLRAFALALAANLIAMTGVGLARTPLAFLAAPLFAVAVLEGRTLRDASRCTRAVYPLAFGGGAVVAAWALAMAW